MTQNGIKFWKAALILAAFLLFWAMLHSLPQSNAPALAQMQKTVTVTADDVTQYYGDTPKELTYTLTGDSLSTEELFRLSIRLKREEGGEIGTYAVTVEWTEQQDISVTAVSGSYTIVKGFFNTEFLSFPDAEYPYDGTERVTLLSGVLPQGIEVQYYNNRHSAAGEYETFAYLSCPSDTYEIVGEQSFSAILSITKKAIDISGLSFLDGNFVYDKTRKGIFISGELPLGVRVKYIGNTAVAAGVYAASARLIYDEENYVLTRNGVNTQENTLFAMLTIEKCKPILHLAATAYQKIYDGVPFRLPVTIVNGEERDLIFTVNGKLASNRFTEVGEYAVSVTTIGDANYHSADAITATLSIRMPSVTQTEGELTARVFSETGFLAGTRAVFLMTEDDVFFRVKFLQEEVVGIYQLSVERDGEEWMEGPFTVALGGIPYGKDLKIFLSDGETYTEIPYSYNGAGEITLNLPQCGYLIVTEAVNTLYYLIGALIFTLTFSILVAVLIVRSRRVYAVFFDTQGGSYLPPVRGNCREVFALPKPERKGMVFAGWAIEKACEAVIVTDVLYRIPKENVVLYAAWDVAEENLMVIDEIF